MEELLKNEEEFTELITKHRNMMYNIAFFIINDTYLAEDAVQETCIRLYKNKDKIEYDDPIKSRNYIFTIVKNVSINIYNQNKKAISVQDDLFSSSINSLLSFDLMMSAFGYTLETLEALDRLENIDKNIIFLKFIIGLKSSEIAEMIGISENAVCKKISKAKRKLNEMIDEKRE